MIWLFPYHILYQPSTNIIPRALARGMILVSRVDTGCDTERAIQYSLYTDCPRVVVRTTTQGHAFYVLIYVTNCKLEKTS